MVVLGAKSAKDIKIEPNGKENTLVSVPKIGTRILLRGVTPNNLNREAIKFFDPSVDGNEKDCGKTGTLVKGTCLYAPAAGHFKKDGAIKECAQPKCQFCDDVRCLDDNENSGVPQHEVLQKLDALEDWAESRTAIKAITPFSNKEEDGISFAKNSVKDEQGVLTADFSINPQKPHFSFEFEYKSRGTAIDWDTKPAIAKGAPATLPFREQWKINGPTVIEWESSNSGEFFTLTFNNRKIKVDNAAEANTITTDSGAVQFGDTFIAAQTWANDKATELGRIKVNFKKSTGGFQKYRVYLNPENGLSFIQTSFSGKDVLKVTFPDNFFIEHPYVSLTTGVEQNIKIREITVRSVNEYAMSKEKPWLKKREAWKLNDKVSVFEFEADNRDCYFSCNPEDSWPIEGNKGPFIIFYGWDNTRSRLYQDGSQVAESTNQLPSFKVGLFYDYSITIDAATSTLSTKTSAGLAMSFKYPDGYFQKNRFCTFGVWNGMEGLTVRNIRRDGKESGVVTRERKGLKVGVLAGSSKVVYELLSPKVWLPANEWVRISIRFSTKEMISIPELKSENGKVFVSDFTGDPTIEEVPVAGDFLIRKASVRATTDLYAVPANDLKNIFVTGFGVDYSTSSDPVEIDIEKLSIKSLGSGANKVTEGDVLVSVNSA